MSVPTTTSPVSSPAIHCPGCGMLVEETKYADHIKSDHQLHRIEIKGAGTVLVPSSASKGPVFLDVPYLGRVRRDIFVYWSFGMVILGWLIGAKII